MREALRFALNQKTLPRAGFRDVLDLAASLGCTGIEARCDLGRPLFDRLAPAVAGREARARGLRLLGLSEVQPFDDWTPERARATRALIAAAAEAGAETVSLVPRVDGLGPAIDGTPARHEEILARVLALAEGSGVVPLVEPIGFPGSSIRRQAVAARAIAACGGTGRLGLVHDTFQHSLAGDDGYEIGHLRLVHVSGLATGRGPLCQADDAARDMPGPGDRTATLPQILQLARLGYRGAFSFEATLPTPRDTAATGRALARAMAWITEAWRAA